MFGLIEGVIICYVILNILMITSGTMKNDKVLENIENSKCIEFISNNNILTKI